MALSDITEERTKAASTDRVWSISKLVAASGTEMQLTSGLHQRHQVTLSSNILELDNPLLRDCLGTRAALVVCTPSVDRLYGTQIKDYLSTLPAPERVGVVVVRRSEASKSIEAAVEVADHAFAHGLRRNSPIVAIGGGVCTDICGLAAALYRRGVPHVKIPTTLVGLVDAGLGIKNAVNHQGRKSAFGSFHPPEHSILDPRFLRTLPRRHIVNGMAEIVKLAVVADRELFDLLVLEGRRLVVSGFVAYDGPAIEVIWRAVAGLLSELSNNLFETLDYRRKLDFGHTFSPYFEVESNHATLHGEAVSLDIALSSQVASDLGLLAADDLHRILSLLAGLGLPITWADTSIEALIASLRSVATHRDGELNLALPTAIGDCCFVGIESIGSTVLQRSHDRLARWATSAMPPPGPSR